VEALKAVNEHWAVRVVEHILPHLHDTVRRDPDEVPVEGSMMEIAEREAVWNGWHSARVRVRHNVRGFEQLVAPEPTHRAVMLVRAHYPLAKLGLMQPLAKTDGLRIDAGSLPAQARFGRSPSSRTVVHRR
jgi:hypothetical protein